jgi:bla regulator protein BlaR1
MRLLPSLLLAVWICGFAAALLFWWLRWRRMTTVIRGAVPVQSGRELDVLHRLERSGGIEQVELIVSETALEPGIVGVFRPVMLLPAGISDRLTDEQLGAIITHELCHVRRRDNLAAAIHMFVEAIFWFHPLVWWIGARLVDERERACDEEVLRLGNESQAYAQGILKVCEFYLESPLVCVAGVTGSNLKKRIEAIMIQRIARKLGFRKKVLLAVLGVLALIGPVVIGLVNAAPTQAQTQFGSAVVPAFESASIKPDRSWDGDPSKPKHVLIKITNETVEITNLSLKELVKYAYDLDDSQISGGADWVNSERYDITVRKTQSANEAMTKLQFQKLLAERFGLAVHREMRNLPLLELVVGKAGLKVNAVQPPNPAAPENRPDIFQATEPCRGETEHHARTVWYSGHANSSFGARQDWTQRGVRLQVGLGGELV